MFCILERLNEGALGCARASLDLPKYSPELYPTYSDEWINCPVLEKWFTPDELESSNVGLDSVDFSNLMADLPPMTTPITLDSLLIPSLTPKSQDDSDHAPMSNSRTGTSSPTALMIGMEISPQANLDDPPRLPPRNNPSCSSKSPPVPIERCIARYICRVHECQEVFVHRRQLE